MITQSSEITINNDNGTLTVSSLQVAKDFGKEHYHVVEAIEELKKECPENSGDLFMESSYQHPQNKRTYKCYNLTRDGFSLLVMGFTGKKALEWKLKYIEAFNLMEQKIRERYSDISPQLQFLIDMERKQKQLEKKQEELESKIADIEELESKIADIEELESKIADIEELESKIADISEIRDNTIKATFEYGRISSELQKSISKTVKIRCIDICGTAQMYEAVHKSIENTIYSDIKKRFEVSSYRELAYNQFADALLFIEMWQPNSKIEKLMYENTPKPNMTFLNMLMGDDE